MRLFDLTTRVELAAFDDPGFHDRLQRARDRGVYAASMVVNNVINWVTAFSSMAAAAVVVGGAFGAHRVRDAVRAHRRPAAWCLVPGAWCLVPGARRLVPQHAAGPQHASGPQHAAGFIRIYVPVKKSSRCCGFLLANMTSENPRQRGLFCRCYPILLSLWWFGEGRISYRLTFTLYK